MKKFNLFLAFLTVSTVVMAAPAPKVEIKTEKGEVKAEIKAPTTPENVGLWNKTKATADAFYNCTLGKVDEVDAILVGTAKAYVIDPFVKPVIDTVGSVATSVKNVTCNVVQYPFVHPLKTTIVAAAAYAIYYAYTEYDNVATKKSQN